MTHFGPEPTPAWNQELRTSAAAVASLIFGIASALGGCLVCGLPPVVAIVTGHIGLARTRQGRLKGHGMALAGLIIGYVLLLPTVVVLSVAVLQPDRAADIVRGFGTFVSNLVA
ncbi:DUF4190 domain-containing protein [Micromonospora echinofusca]|uniref:DUF4190 domain-containing protein n=1 Tax=Micromonospora echinofusca TaxID=47858 RepID=UPI001AD66A8D|nr:DUF4190 domain-containing protein [Micromonospora echinofusca]